MEAKEYSLIMKGIIPATQEAFKGGDKIDSEVRKDEKECVKIFKKAVSDYVTRDKPSDLFPSNGKLYVAIVQFFTSDKKDYQHRDVDNMAKTVLDALNQGGLYGDDSRVRTLLVSKIIDLKKVPQNLGFIYIKILDDGEDEIFTENIIDQAVVMYNDMRENNVEIS